MNKILYLAILMTSMLYGCKGNSSASQNSSVQPEWEAECMEKGKEIVSASFTALSGALSQAMQNGGMENALQFCNVNAIPLTDSLSKTYNVDIKRTSFKHRNPKNKPTDSEKKILNMYGIANTNGELMEIICKEEDGEKKFYAPIILMDACLKCHGEKSSISNYDQIRSLYPEDKAIDYKSGDLRGMWSITFRKK